MLDSSTNFVLATVRAKDRSPLRAAQIYEELAKRDIYVRYFDVPGLDDKLRISVGTKQQNETLLAALKEILG